MSQKIEVILRADGTFTFHVQGVSGMDCTQITAPLQDVLGPFETELTSEAFQVAAAETETESTWLTEQ